jgi:hypothetical protein
MSLIVSDIVDNVHYWGTLQIIVKSIRPWQIYLR